MANSNTTEKEIAKQFLLLTNHDQKIKFISNLSKNSKLTKILKFLPNDSARIEFLRMSRKKGLFLNKWLRDYNKKRKKIANNLISTKGNYKEVKTILNPLRKSGEGLLRKEAIKNASDMSEKYNSFFKQIERAENIAEVIKESNYNTDAINNIFLKNKDTIKSNNTILENLKDIFDNDESLHKYQDEFNIFLVNQIENNKPINQIIAEAEERILSGDISNVYQEIEKTENLISHNLGQALIEVYNAIQVMDAKRSFIQYINDFERESISYNEINQLANKANEYRNVELPNKWSEMNHKLQFTKDIPHYKAWFLGLQQGRYKNVVSNIKEYIAKDLIKKLIKTILKKIQEITLEDVKFYSLLESKQSSEKDIKKAYKSFFDLKEVKKNKDDGFIKLLDSYIIYYFYLKYDISLEVEIISKILNKLKSLSTYSEKTKYITGEKTAIKNSIKDNNLQNEIDNIFNKLIILFNILNEKEIENNKIKKLQEEKLETPNETIDFLDSLNKDFEKTGKIKDISLKVNSLPGSKSIDAITAIKFDPRFEKYYPEVENTLYFKDWGRTLGVISIKTKEIEKNKGAFASEQYLEDVANRISTRLGEDSFVVQKIRNMKENLEKLHADGAKKLRYLRERLDKAKSSAEKILELQKISKNPDFKGIFGTIQNLERILIRDKFDEIYKKVKHLPIETQKALFDGVFNDLKDLFKFEPQVFNNINRYIKEINITLENSKKQTTIFSDKQAEALEKFENGDLPLIDLSDMMELDYPSKNKYSPANIQKNAVEYSHELNTGALDGDDLEFIIDDINNDMSLFKIDGCDEAISQIENAGKYKKTLDEKVARAKEIEALKESKSIKDFINGVFRENGENFEEELNIINRGFSEKELVYDELKKGYGIVSKVVKEKESKTKINEIVEVIRRIEKEVDPLQTIESKIAKIGEWIYKDYKDKKHIIDFLNNQIRDLALAKGREGGLLRKLLDGLDNADDKIKYLKEKLNDLEYRYLRPTLLTLIENIKEELKILDDKIDKEWINKQLVTKSEDEKLGWLKVRKAWNKYDKHKELIDAEINKSSKKISGKKSETLVIYQDIIDLANACLEQTGQAARQKLIKLQEDGDPIINPAFSTKRKLLFYLMSVNSDEPDKRVLALTERATLKIPDKQKLLKLLKDINIPGKGTLKEKLGIKDEDIAFAAVHILYSDNPLEKRIRLLERFKSETEEKFENYKKSFEITDNIVFKVINFLKKKNSTHAEKEESSETTPIEEKVESVETYGESPEVEEKSVIEGMNEHEEVTKKEKEEIKDDFTQSTDMEDQLMDIDETSTSSSGELIDLELEKEVKGAFTKNNAKQWEKQSAADGLKEEPANIPFEKSIEINDAKPEVFTEEAQSWEEKKGETKSSGEIIKEQELRKEYKKLAEKFEEKELKEFAEQLENRGKKISKESANKIREKAKEIKEDRQKKLEDKIKGLLIYLTTCFPEAVPAIIADEILPIFRGEGLDLEVHNLLQTINNSIFKNALSGKDVDDNIKFLSKSLSKESVNSLNSIVNKIKELWINGLKSKRSHGVKEEQKKGHKPEISNEIKETNSFGRILSYLNGIYPAAILDEIEHKLLRSIKNDSINNKLRSFHKKLEEFYKDKDFTDDEKKLFYVKLKLDINEQKLFDALINKIEQYKKDREKINEVENTPEPDKTSGTTPITAVKPKVPEKAKIVDDSLDAVLDKNHDNELLDMPNENEVTDNAEEETSSGPEKDVEDLLSGMSSFVKPHAIILNFVRNHGELNEDDFDVDARRDIIDRLFNRGKIFTYDGTTYIGNGQIDSIVKSNVVIGPDKPIFIRKLDAFLDKFDTPKQLFEFLGVNDEMEYRKLNYALDKYGGDRKIPRCLKSSEENSTNNKPARDIGNKIKKVSHDLVDSLKEEIDKAIPINKPEKNPAGKSTFDIKKEKIKEREEKKKDAQMSLSELKKKNEEFISKNQRELLNEASKSINKGIERLIKTAQNTADLEAIYGSYFGSGVASNRNLLNLCYDIKKIAEIISKDKLLLSKLSFDKIKMKKLYDSKIKKFKK